MIVVPFVSGVNERVREEFPIVEFAVRKPSVELPTAQNLQLPIPAQELREKENVLLSTSQSIDEASPFQVEEF